MRLTVLGTSAAYAPADRACSGYLIEDEGSSLLVDCGSGVASNLFHHRDPLTLDGIVISHLHFDHFLDLYPLHYYYRFNSPPGFSPVPLWAPPGAHDHMLCLFHPGGEEEFERYMTFEAVDDEASCVIGGFTLTFRRVPHATDSYAMRITGTRTLAYSADSEYSEELLILADGADMLLCESTFAGRESGIGTSHFTAAEVGKMASEAGVSAVVATHFWPTTDREQAAAEIRAGFDGPVHVAEENRSIDV